jgi:hypothetical protein
MLGRWLDAAVLWSCSLLLEGAVAVLRLWRGRRG